MTKPYRKGEAAKGAFHSIDAITSRIGKIKTLIGAAVGLLVLLLTLFADVRNAIRKLVTGDSEAKASRAPSHCVEVDSLMIPARVKYSEWENMRFTLSGHSDCVTSQDLFVTFRRRGPRRRYDVIPPYNESPECNGLPVASLQEPSCWDSLRSNAKGAWNVPIRPPPLELVSDPPPSEKIVLAWAVRASDAPAQPSMGASEGEIEVKQ